MRNYRWAIPAVVTALILSSFTARTKSTRLWTDGTAWYNYYGLQTATERRNAYNYVLASYTPSCMGGVNECSVNIYVELDIFGNPPYHPDFTNVNFNPATGMPIVGMEVISNKTSY